MPVPMINIINRGIHANWQGADLQEYMILSRCAHDFHEALRYGSETCYAIRNLLMVKDYSTGVSDESGFALDPASGGFYRTGYYLLKTKDPAPSAGEMVRDYPELVEQHPIVVIEIGLAEDDWAVWKVLTDLPGDRV